MDGEDGKGRRGVEGEEGKGRRRVDVEEGKGRRRVDRVERRPSVIFNHKLVILDLCLALSASFLCL